MKKLLSIITLFTLFSSFGFSYDISKKFDYEYSPDYTIEVTNESTYYTDDNGDKIFYHTVLVIDHKSSIIYKWYCDTENDALKKYRELINTYTSSYQIKSKLIPELEEQVVSLSVSDNGKWMHCRLSEYLYTDYSNISTDDLLDILEERQDEGEISDEDVMCILINQFDDFNSFINLLLQDADKEEISEFIILPVLKIYANTNQDNKELDEIINALKQYLESSDSN